MVEQIFPSWNISIAQLNSVFRLENGSETLQLIHEAYGYDALRPWKWSSELEVIKRSKSPVPLSWSFQQTVCSTFCRHGWSIVRSASLAKGGTSKKRPSPHLHKVLTQSNEVSPQIFKRPSYKHNRLIWQVYWDGQFPWHFVIIQNFILYYDFHVV
jgi:hypothetical protein